MNKEETTHSNENPGRKTTLTIRWQRLLDESGRTCDRCTTTGEGVKEACELLAQALAPLGIEVGLEELALDPATFALDPIKSNRIWIGNESIEDLLGATVGQSQCCSVCGESQCRTITVDGNVHEAITSSMIVKAGMFAAARMFSATPSSCEPSCGCDAEPCSCTTP